MTKLCADDVFIFVLFLKCRVKTSLQDLSAFSRFSQRAEISPMNPKNFVSVNEPVGQPDSCKEGLSPRILWPFHVVVL